MANEKRLIYADELMASLRESLDELRKIGDGLSYHEDKQICNGQICTFLEAIMRVREQPTVDAVEVVHGRWIEDVATDMIACTECGHAWNIIDNCTETFNYCPNCGAKMDGGNEDGSAQA